ncbi:uncharacterized protein K452DRAFT_272777 [Aplosporella prunicola CBS 121167]|uniref:Ribophorin II C-terminal domain-containing protein n=1 Tax=Aplosporella prunicola CBS 121167 TaxID=1176127 RepID=A0A6A6BEU4_9PEZI|nr:uncharacterized protein K452DRAFT_272777 [Aplosporella prunicola CBS 121167]KAF2141001.1 hypothetical protein K452DRAFT_272777 [Aplosporella prunicola CBS 121167]
MRFSLLPSVLLAGLSAVSTVAAASWGFEDATVTVQGKGGVGSGLKEKLSVNTPLANTVELGATDTLKIILTTTDGKKAKRPHQAFLTLMDPATGLEDSFPFTIKDSGKGKVEVTHKDLPAQFLTASAPVTATLTIGSFGSSKPYSHSVFNLAITRDPNVPLALPSPPIRYGPQPEIHHVFKDDPRNPPMIITLVFGAVIAVTLPVLFGVWLMLGANLNHAGKALGSAPISHGLFFGSIVALEGIFFLYYTCWNLFQTLPAAAAVGAIAYISGSRALSEVQERRLAGLR